MNLHLTVAEAKYWYVSRPSEKLLLWFVGKLPRKLVMRCYCRVGAYATTGKWSDTVVPEITMMEALRRWDVDNTQHIV